MPKPACVNRKIIARLQRFYGGKILKKLIDLFFENGPKKIEAALAAGNMKNYEAVASAVHGLISSAGTLGAVELQKLAQTIQDAASHERGKEISRLLPELKPTFEKVKSLLEKEKVRKS